MSEHVLKAESEEDPDRAQDDDTGDCSSDVFGPHLAGNDEHDLPVHLRFVRLQTHIRSCYSTEQCINSFRFQHCILLKFTRSLLCAALIDSGEGVKLIAALLKRLQADKGPMVAKEAWAATGLSLLDFVPKVCLPLTQQRIFQKPLVQLCIKAWCNAWEDFELNMLLSTVLALTVSVGTAV